MTGRLAEEVRGWRRNRPIKRAELARWEECTTAEQVGELVARWLEGKITYNPGYLRAGPDPETYEAGLSPALVAANRAGYVTHQSQPGWTGTTYRGEYGEQCAAAQGVCADPSRARALLRVARAAGLNVFYGSTPRRRCQYSDRWHRRETAGQFETLLARADLGLSFGEVGDAIYALLDGTQIVITDPEPGRNDRLQPALHRFARS